MKTKKNKNLDLNKATVVNLDETSMNHIKGGYTLNDPTTPTSSCGCVC